MRIEYAQHMSPRIANTVMQILGFFRVRIEKEGKLAAVEILPDDVPEKVPPSRPALEAAKSGASKLLQILYWSSLKKRVRRFSHLIIGDYPMPKVSGSRTS